MDADKLFEGIALLIDLAQRGEIDPWDVQVIDVIDRYLSQLIPAHEATQSAAYEADLSQSGQAFLSASMLVLFKANTLTELESPETQLDQSTDNFLPEVADGTVSKLRLPLEQQLRRRPAALPPQKRRVTLPELIEQLQLMAAHMQRAQEALALSTKTTRKSLLHSQSRTQAIRATLELAHQENLTEVAGELEQCLNCYSLNVPNQEQNWLNLDMLVELWTKKTRSLQADAIFGSILPEETSISSKTPGKSAESFLPPQTHERVSVFWALLLLSAQSKVELLQEEFYQDIKIRKLELE